MTTPKSAPPSAETVPISAPQDGTSSAASPRTPYVPEKKTPSFSLRENARVLVMGAGVALILLLLALNGVTHKSRSVRSEFPSGQQRSDLAANESAIPASVTPIMEIGALARAEDARAMTVNALQIEQTAARKPSPVSAPALKLASVPPLEDRSWQPPLYPGNARNLATSEAPVSRPENHKQERQLADKNSLVFIAKTSALAPRREPEILMSSPEHIALPAGSRLRAKLESAINSAVQAPVVAVIEYNYERNGEIVVPAGARATGKLISADRSGTVEIRFDSLLFPYAVPIAFDAIATDLRMRPLRGHVEGTKTGRNFLVRSAAGIGELASTLLGRGSLNRPFSEDDLLRERLSTNIGQAADQQISNTALSARLVVSLEAGTEIYIVLEKRVTDHEQRAPQPMNSSSQNLDELRQLLELQRELNASVKVAVN